MNIFKNNNQSFLITLFFVWLQHSISHSFEWFWGAAYMFITTYCLFYLVERTASRKVTAHDKISG